MTTVWIAPSATSFSCLCEPCLEAARTSGALFADALLAARASRVDLRRDVAGIEAPLRRRPRDRAAPRRAPARARASRREAAAAHVIERQHVWLGPEATTFDEPCEACLSAARVARRRVARRPRDAAARRRRRLHDVPPRPPHRHAPRRPAARGRLARLCPTPQAPDPSKRMREPTARPRPRVPSTVVVGAQWGDEGKGKIVDLLAQESDVVCRYQGGPNAGHTIVAGGETFKIRQTPSGVISGKTSVIGAGCVVDPQVLLDELDELAARGIDPSVVVVSGNAHLIMPWHVAIDQASERRLGHLQIGTTRRGIGPAYADKASRIGIRVQDVLDPKILRQKIEVALAEKNLWLERIYESEPFDLEDGVVAVRRASRSGSRRTSATCRCSSTTALRAGKDVLFEGAQATLLDLDHGTYPFVTSSNPIASGAATGIGIGPTRIDRVLGVSKAYVTRVGEGPFPSEIRGAGPGPAARARRRVRHGHRPRAPLRLARPRRAALRGARQRDDLARADEARRALGLRGAAGLRPLPAARRLRDRALPGAPVGLPPRGAGVGDARRLARAARRRVDARRAARGGAASTSSSSRKRSTCRSSSSASARRANASSSDAPHVVLAYTADAWTQVIVGALDLRPGRRRGRAHGLGAARREERPRRAALAASAAGRARARGGLVQVGGRVDVGDDARVELHDGHVQLVVRAVEGVRA